jgi:hypothetical protein
MDHGKRRRTAQAAGTALVALLVPTAAAHAQSGLRPLPPYEARLVDFAREGAMRRLRGAECRALLDELHDREGRPLVARLETFGVPADLYLENVPFLDGTGRPLCGRGQSQLLTVSGVPRVIVCPSFLQTVERARVSAEVYVIHEMLHTLGLGENPPSSQEITRLVTRHCAP